MKINRKESALRFVVRLVGLAVWAGVLAAVLLPAPAAHAGKKTVWLLREGQIGKVSAASDCNLKLKHSSKTQVVIRCKPIEASAQAVETAQAGAKTEKKTIILPANKAITINAYKCELLITRNQANRIEVLCRIPPAPAPDGRWSGTTDMGQSVYFLVTDGGTKYSKFKFKGYVGTCLVEFTQTDVGAVEDGYLVLGGYIGAGTLYIVGHFDSTKELTGEYEADNVTIEGCGAWTQKGKWFAKWKGNGAGPSVEAVGAGLAQPGLSWQVLGTP